MSAFHWAPQKGFLYLNIPTIAKGVHQTAPYSSVSSESLHSEYFGNWLDNWYNEHWDTDESMTCGAENANTALDNDFV